MPILYTIGYGGRKPSELIEALNEYQIHWVVDVRLRPGAYLKLFRASERGMQFLLEPAIGYRWMPNLGNDFDTLEEYQHWIESHPLAFIELVERLSFVTNTNICLLCAERKLEECHRSIIAEEAVKELNKLKVTQTKWEVKHID